MTTVNFGIRCQEVPILSDGDRYFDWKSHFLLAMKCEAPQLAAALMTPPESPTSAKLVAERKPETGPANADDESTALGARADPFWSSLALSYLRSALSPSIVATIRHLKAHEAWTALFERYGRPHPARVEALRIRFDSITQGSDSVDEFLQRVLEIVSILRSLEYKVPVKNVICKMTRGLAPRHQLMGEMAYRRAHNQYKDGMDGQKVILLLYNDVRSRVALELMSDSGNDTQQHPSHAFGNGQRRRPRANRCR